MFIILTQHRHGVETVQTMANLALMRGNIGRPGAGSGSDAMTDLAGGTAEEKAILSNRDKKQHTKERDRTASGSSPSGMATNEEAGIPDRSGNYRASRNDTVGSSLVGARM